MCCQCKPSSHPQSTPAPGHRAKGGKAQAHPEAATKMFVRKMSLEVSPMELLPVSFWVKSCLLLLSQESQPGVPSEGKALPHTSAQRCGHC